MKPTSSQNYALPLPENFITFQSFKNTNDYVAVLRMSSGPPNSGMEVRSSIERTLQHVADSAEAQLSELGKCLELIDRQIPAKGPGWAPNNEEEWWWMLRRLEALRQFDRVATALKLGNGYGTKIDYSYRTHVSSRLTADISQYLILFHFKKIQGVQR